MVVANPFLIVGAGRSGTTYCQAVHAICGIPTSHQKVFTWETSVTADAIDWRGFAGEASFMGVPKLDLLRLHHPEVRTVLVRRSSVDIGRSWVERGAFGSSMRDTYPDWATAIDVICPNAWSSRFDQGRAIKYAAAWQKYAESRVSYVFDLESMRLEDLFSATGHYQSYDACLAGSVSHNINSGRPKP